MRGRVSHILENRAGPSPWLYRTYLTRDAFWLVPFVGPRSEGYQNWVDRAVLKLVTPSPESRSPSALVRVGLWAGWVAPFEAEEVIAFGRKVEWAKV